jgi:hypothetical protein
VAVEQQMEGPAWTGFGVEESAGRYRLPAERGQGKSSSLATLARSFAARRQSRI